MLVAGEALELCGRVHDARALAEMEIRPAGGGREPLARWAQRHGATRAQLTAARTAVLCYGSNAAPAALARKFAGLGADCVIPAVRGRLRDFDAVYSAHVSKYGAIPATLRRSAGAELRVFTVALTDPQLELMHRSEGPYDFRALEPVQLSAGLGCGCERVLTYISQAGALLLDGEELALAAVPARGRSLRAMSEIEILTWLRDQLAPGVELERFVLEQARDLEVRRERAAWLRARSSPFA